VSFSRNTSWCSARGIEHTASPPPNCLARKIQQIIDGFRALLNEKIPKICRVALRKNPTNYYKVKCRGGSPCPPAYI